jgi:hypothetical protein
MMTQAIRLERRCILVWMLILSFIISVAPCAQAQEETAITFGFTADRNGLPISATTEFFNLGANPDLTNTAHHELLHAIGFTTRYNLFNQRVRPRNDGTGRRDFWNADDTLLLAILVPLDQGTHVDPNAGVVNGFNQRDSVMRPDQVVGQRMGNFERDILDAAFAWTGRNLRITVEFRGQWTQQQRDAINDAVNSAQRLFGSNGSGHEFKWTVIPEPSSMMAMLMGIGFTSCLIRRHRSKREADA